MKAKVKSRDRTTAPPAKPLVPISDSAGRDAVGRLQSLHDPVKQRLKGGVINLTTRDLARELSNFIDAEEQRVREEIERRGERGEQVELLLLKSFAMCSEVFQQFGLVDEAEAVAREGKKFLEHVLPLEGPCNLAETESRELLRERVRLIVDFVLAHYYRRHRYTTAKSIILRCRDFVEGTLREAKTFPCHGTLGQIYAALGRCSRQLADTDAEEFFSRAVEHHFQRARRKFEQFSSDSQEHREARREELALATLRSGISLGLGIGWVNYAKGHLRQALHNNLIPARVLLLHASDDLSAAYVDLILASVKRALAKEGETSLSEAADLALRSYEVFRHNEHSRYVARAAWELGLIYLHSGRLEDADAKATEVLNISRELNDRRWLCNSLIILSRIERKRGQLSEADRLASEAIELSGERNQRLCRINALIARGVTKIELGETKLARKDLTQALGLNREPAAADDTRPVNPKIEALCCLHLARSYAHDREGARAEEYLQRWKAIREEVEHRYVRDLAEEVEGEICALEADFVIKATTGTDLNYKKHLRALQKFLIDQAKNDSSEKQKVASKLGITRQALYEWEKEIKKQDERGVNEFAEGHPAGNTSSSLTHHKKFKELK
jgi:tetratricopeptide (TPR) repeat protein